MNTNDDRFETEPLLLLLEGYVLACIGELTPEGETRLGEVVDKAFAGDQRVAADGGNLTGDWQARLRANLQLDGSLDDTIRTIWRETRALQTDEEPVTPKAFARMVVAQNFAHLA